MAVLAARRWLPLGLALAAGLLWPAAAGARGAFRVHGVELRPEPARRLGPNEVRVGDRVRVVVILQNTGDVPMRGLGLALQPDRPADELAPGPSGQLILPGPSAGPTGFAAGTALFRTPGRVRLSVVARLENLGDFSNVSPLVLGTVDVHVCPPPSIRILEPAPGTTLDADQSLSVRWDVPCGVNGVRLWLEPAGGGEEIPITTGSGIGATAGYGPPLPAGRLRVVGQAILHESDPGPPPRASVEIDVRACPPVAARLFDPHPGDTFFRDQLVPLRAEVPRCMARADLGVELLGSPGTTDNRQLDLPPRLPVATVGPLPPGRYRAYVRVWDRTYARQAEATAEFTVLDQRSPSQHLGGARPPGPGVSCGFAFRAPRPNQVFAQDERLVATVAAPCLAPGGAVQYQLHALDPAPRRVESRTANLQAAAFPGVGVEARLDFSGPFEPGPYRIDASTVEVGVRTWEASVPIWVIQRAMAGLPPKGDGAKPSGGQSGSVPAGLDELRRRLGELDQKARVLGELPGAKACARCAEVSKLVSALAARVKAGLPAGDVARALSDARKLGPELDQLAAELRKSAAGAPGGGKAGEPGAKKP